MCVICEGFVLYAFVWGSRGKSKRTTIRSLLLETFTVQHSCRYDST